MKAGLEEKNASLAETIAQLKQELRSAERARTKGLDEKQCLQSQLGNAGQKVEGSTGDFKTAQVFDVCLLCGSILILLKFIIHVS